MGITFGWSSAASSDPSRRKRSRYTGSMLTSSRSTFNATARPFRESVARYTMPVRPQPTIPSIL